MRALVHLVLIFFVALGSVTMAQARHQPRIAAETVLCTGIGMIAVAVDAEGRPTGPMLPCPDCTPALAAIPAAAPAVGAPVQRLTAAAPPALAEPGPVGAPLRTRTARAPPVAV